MAVSAHATKFVPGKVTQPDGTVRDSLIEIPMTPEEIAIAEQELAVERQKDEVAKHERGIEEARARLAEKQQALDAVQSNDPPADPPKAAKK